MAYREEASHVYDLSGRTAIDHLQWRQNKQYERSMRYAIDSAACQIVGSNEQLADRNIHALEQLRGGLTFIEHSLDGVAEEIRRQAEDIRSVRDAVVDGANQVTSALYWGFTQTFALIGRTNDKLDALYRIARTPSHNWAMEQFDNARDEYRRGLYAEALESVDRAINGYGGNPGYKTEFRSNLLLGTLRLGDNRNVDASIVDASLAETAFLNAARYAGTDYPQESGNALIWAGRAAFVGRDFKRALDHTSAGIALAPHHSIGHYQLSRLLLIHSRPAQAVEHLARAVALNPELSLSALADHEFLDDRNGMQAGLAEGLHRLERIFAESFSALSNARKGLRSMDMAGGDYDDVMRDHEPGISAAVAEVQAAYSTGTILGIGDSLKAIRIAEDLVAAAARAYPGACAAWARGCADYFSNKSGEARRAAGSLSKTVDEGKRDASDEQSSGETTALTAFWVIFLSGSLFSCSPAVHSIKGIFASAAIAGVVWAMLRSTAASEVAQKRERIAGMQREAAALEAEAHRLTRVSDEWRRLSYGPENERKSEADRLIRSFQFESARQKGLRIACGEGSGRAIGGAAPASGGRHAPHAEAPVEPNRAAEPPGNGPSPRSRNAICSCGSGKKYKHCHGALS